MSSAKSRLDEIPLPTAEDPLVAVYMEGVDRTLLRENLKLTPEERLRKMMRAARLAEKLRRAGRKQRLEK